MGLPNNKELYLPILKFFSDKKIHNKEEIYERTVDYFKLSEEDLNQLLKNTNLLKFERKFNLVISNLVRSHSLVRKGRDLYVISSRGLKLLDTNSSEFIDEYLRKQWIKEESDNVMNVNIQNFGAITESSIDIKKINVIGGQNATGKSTASKLLYTFLKYSSANRQKDAYESIINQIRNLVIMVRRLFSLRKNAEFNNFINSNYAKFMYNDDVYDILQRYENLKDMIFSEEFDDSYSKSRSKDRIFAEIGEIDNYIELIEEDGEYLFNLIMKDSFESEFSNKMKGHVEFGGSFEGDEFKFNSNFNEDYQFCHEGTLLINDIFYIDSFSSLDINQSNGLNNTNHVQSLLKAIEEDSNESNDLFDPIKNYEIELILNDIDELIGGKLLYEDGELKYSDEYGISCYMSNTASGIKQIGIIQLLLGNRKLKKNSFLIIDEPEVNLHPEWQLKLAEILVMLAKSLNIYVYVNTHSPMFIEAMNLYSEKYGLLNDTNFYLTQKHKLGGFYFRKIMPHELGLVYKNLAEPYDILDKVKVDILKMRGNNEF